MKKFILACVCIVMVCVTDAQVVERQRPASWDSLVLGGRFMDRLLPMKGTYPDECRKKWGAQAVQNRYVDNGIESDSLSIWGGNILQTRDGKYHLYVCGWLENSPKGHMEWPKSTVYHATSDALSGPYQIDCTIGKGHNPEAFRLDDGRIVVYVIDGYYIADKEDSKNWKYSKFEFQPRDRRIIEGLSNLTFARRQDGSRLMICRGGGVWVSRDGVSPYGQLSHKRVYPDVEGRFEDPVVWRDSIQYHLIVNDWLGRIAYYMRSLDGLHWVYEQGEAYMPGLARHPDGQVEEWFKYERPKVFQDTLGRVVQMNFAVIDTIKWEDKPNDTHSSKNICVPMNKGLILEVLNRKPITRLTKTIKVKISAENGFDPQKDLDVSSLTFGSFNEVNFGRGSRPLSVTPSGNDLIVVFDGKGSGMTEEEFAPKMIGRDKNGNMVFGYARLPYINYKPSILSSLKPKKDEARGGYSMTVQNFGLSKSSACQVALFRNGQEIGRTKIKALKPYETAEVVIGLKDKDIPVDFSSDDEVKVVFLLKGKVLDSNVFSYKQ